MDKDSEVVRCGRKTEGFCLGGLYVNIEVRGMVMVAAGRMLLSLEGDTKKRREKRVKTQTLVEVEEAMAV